MRCKLWLNRALYFLLVSQVSKIYFMVHVPCLPSAHKMKFRMFCQLSTSEYFFSGHWLTVQKFSFTALKYKSNRLIKSIYVDIWTNQRAIMFFITFTHMMLLFSTYNILFSNKIYPTIHNNISLQFYSQLLNNNYCSWIIWRGIAVAVAVAIICNNKSKHVIWCFHGIIGITPTSNWRSNEYDPQYILLHSLYFCESFLLTSFNFNWHVRK